MKNVINYYYNLYPEKIFQNKDEYYFFINNIRYTLIEYKEDIKKIEEIYKIHLDILRKNIYVPPIILNKDNKPLTIVKGKPYILMQTIYYGEKTNIQSIISFLSVDANINRNNNWEEMWKNKNDYIEYQINLIGNKYKILKKSIYYYLGLGENAIELLNITKPSNIKMYYTVQTLHGGQQFFGLHPVRRLLSQLRAQLHQFMPLSFILIHKIDRKRAKLLQHGIDLIDIIIFSLGHIDSDLVKIIQNLCHILFACPVDCS